MSWTGVAMMTAIIALLSLILVLLYIVYSQGKKVGKQEGVEDENKKVSKSVDDLAHKLYDGNPLFRVSDADPRKGVTAKTDHESGVAEDNGDRRSGQHDGLRMSSPD